MNNASKDMSQVFIYMFAGALITFQALTAGAAGQKAVHCETKAAITVLFFGDSLTAAHGLALEQGFAGLIRKKVARFSYPIQVIIAGVSGETTAGGVRRIGWLLRRKIDVMVLALGGNDGLRGIDPESMRENLQEIIDRARKSSPHVKIIVAGMEAPPNMGTDYTSRFRRVFKDVAAANDAALIPFLLAGVAGVPALNLPDGIHPNVEGHKIVANNVWKVLGPLLESMSAAAGKRSAPQEKGVASKKGDDSEILENCKD